MLSPEALDDVFGAVDVRAVERLRRHAVERVRRRAAAPSPREAQVPRGPVELRRSSRPRRQRARQPAAAAAPGPARGGVGASAFFNGTLYSEVPHAPAFESPEVTVSFWLWLMQDSTGAWRTLLSKGDGEQELTPTVQLWPHTRQLHVRVTTVGRQVVAFDSAAMVPLQRWTHVALVVQGKLVQIYVNGIADTQHVLTSAAHFNRGPLYVGRDPWQPGAQAFLDDLTVHAAALSDGRLASRRRARKPVSPSFVRLGCSNCSLEAARNACADLGRHHLCFEDEAMGGAYMASRAMGWSHGRTAASCGTATGAEGGGGGRAAPGRVLRTTERAGLGGGRALGWGVEEPGGTGGSSPMSEGEGAEQRHQGAINKNAGEYHHRVFNTLSTL